MSTHGPKDWLKSARVRFTQFARAKYSKDYAREEVALTRSYGCDTLVFFVEVDGWTLYPSRFAEMDFTVGKHDLFGDVREECRKQHVKLIAAFMGMHCQTYHFREHPDWCVVHHSTLFPDSPLAGHDRECFERDVMSLHSPYRQVLLGQVEEVLTRYQPDGVYFDGIYHTIGYDYSDGARAGFHERFGREIPEDLLDPDWLKWHRDQCPGFARDVRALIDEHLPHAVLVLDNHGPTVGTYDSGESVDRSAEYLDAPLLEAYFECSGETPRFIAQESLMLAAETHLPVWWARWAARSCGHLPVALPETTMLTWLCDVVATGSVPVTVDQEAFWHDRTLQKPMKRAQARIAKLRRLVGDTEPIPHVALFHSMNRKHERMHENLLAVRGSFEGLYRALEEAHIPFSIVTERDIFENKLKDFAALAVPNVEEMSRDVADRIRAFVAKGGGLVATFRSSFKDEFGQTRDAPALADVLGIKRINGGVMRCPIYDGYDYGYPTVNEPANLFEIVKSHPVTRGLLLDNLYAYAGRLVDASVSKDTTMLTRTRLYDAEFAKSGRFFRYQPTEKWAEGLAFTRQHGRGRVVWFAGDIDRAVWEIGNLECAVMLVNATNWAARRKPPVTCVASPLIAMRTRHNPQTGAMQIGLTNYAQSQVFSPGFSGIFNQHGPELAQAIRRRDWPVHVSPVRDVLVSVAWHDRKQPRIETLSGQTPRVRHTDDLLEMSIAEVREGEVIALAPQ